MRLILASTSPRRKALLEKLGIPFDIIAPRCQEVTTPHLTVEEQVVAFASLKARSIGISDAFVLGSDTLVVVDNAQESSPSQGSYPLILGKPVDISDARRMLTLLRGRAHRVITGVALMVPRGPEAILELWHEVSEVQMRDMTNEEIERYLSTEEPYDKAGAYAIQGEGGRFIKRVLGEIDNVVGLPLQSVATALKRHGFVVSKSLI